MAHPMQNLVKDKKPNLTPLLCIIHYSTHIQNSRQFCSVNISLRALCRKPFLSPQNSIGKGYSLSLLFLCTVYVVNITPTTTPHNTQQFSTLTHVAHENSSITSILHKVSSKENTDTTLTFFFSGHHLCQLSCCHHYTSFAQFC